MCRRRGCCRSERCSICSALNFKDLEKENAVMTIAHMGNSPWSNDHQSFRDAHMQETVHLKQRYGCKGKSIFDNLLCFNLTSTKTFWPRETAALAASQDKGHHPHSIPLGTGIRVAKYSISLSRHVKECYQVVGILGLWTDIIDSTCRLIVDLLPKIILQKKILKLIVNFLMAKKFGPHSGSVSPCPDLPLYRSTDTNSS